MSLPSFPAIDPPIEREDAVNQILSSKVGGQAS